MTLNTPNTKKIQKIVQIDKNGVMDQFESNVRVFMTKEYKK